MAGENSDFSVIDANELKESTKKNMHRTECYNDTSSDTDPQAYHALLVSFQSVSKRYDNLKYKYTQLYKYVKSKKGGSPIGDRNLDDLQINEVDPLSSPMNNGLAPTTPDKSLYMSDDFSMMEDKLRKEVEEYEERELDFRQQVDDLRAENMGLKRELDSERSRSQHQTHILKEENKELNTRLQVAQEQHKSSADSSQEMTGSVSSLEELECLRSLVEELQKQQTQNADSLCQVQAISHDIQSNSGQLSVQSDQTLTSLPSDPDVEQTQPKGFYLPTSREPTENTEQTQPKDVYLPTSQQLVELSKKRVRAPPGFQDANYFEKSNPEDGVPNNITTGVHDPNYFEKSNSFSSQPKLYLDTKAVKEKCANKHLLRNPDCGSLNDDVFRNNEPGVPNSVQNCRRASTGGNRQGSYLHQNYNDPMFDTHVLLGPNMNKPRTRSSYDYSKPTNPFIDQNTKVSRSESFPRAGLCTRQGRVITMTPQSNVSQNVQSNVPQYVNIDNTTSQSQRLNNSGQVQNYPFRSTSSTTGPMQTSATFTNPEPQPPFNPKMYNTAAPDAFNSPSTAVLRNPGAMAPSTPDTRRNANTNALRSSGSHALGNMGTDAFNKSGTDALRNSILSAPEIPGTHAPTIQSTDALRTPGNRNPVTEHKPSLIDALDAPVYLPPCSSDLDQPSFPLQNDDRSPPVDRRIIDSYRNYQDAREHLSDGSDDDQGAGSVVYNPHGARPKSQNPFTQPLPHSTNPFSQTPGYRGSCPADVTLNNVTPPAQNILNSDNIYRSASDRTPINFERNFPDNDTPAARPDSNDVNMLPLEIPVSNHNNKPPDLHLQKNDPLRSHKVIPKENIFPPAGNPPMPSPKVPCQQADVTEGDCPVCGQTFSQEELEAHAWTCTGNPLTQPCPICQREFPKDEIERHVNFAHLDNDNEYDTLVDATTSPAQFV